TAGILAAPHVWVALPTQLVTVSLATSVGLYWGRDRSRDPPEAAPEPSPTGAAPVARAPSGTCPIG
ncbi:MAG TPA: hypothetical protein VD838_16165, partial [Anaeromyxobacteraceae bacterium]|nr:hypothetical protein [Anaeromyxobacteraceae bacterium]